MLVNVHGVVIVNRYGEIVNTYGPMLAFASRAALISARSWDPVIVNSYGVIVNASTL